MRLHDISVTLDADTPRYPGDPPVGLQPLTRLARGDPSNLSALALGTHAGTHLDVPLHLLDGGAAADQVSLERCFGPALVRAFPVGRPITPADLEAAPHRADVPRLLFKGADGSQPRRADAGGAGPLTEQAAAWLVDRGVVLVGVDALSVDEYGSAELPVHRTLLSAGVLILEGLDMTSVAEGLYTLACFPLKIAGADGSPVRAVLVEPPLAGDH